MLLLITLPFSYQEEAKYYFEEQIKQGDSFSCTVFDYFLGGIGYRLRKVMLLLSRVLGECVYLIKHMGKFAFDISKVNSKTRSNI